MPFSFRDHLDALNHGSPAGKPPLPPEVQADGAIPDDLVDHMLDGEVDPQRARELFGLIRRDREASKRFDATQGILRTLRASDNETECPDFSARVLARVASRSGLFSASGFRAMLAYRYAAAAAVLLAIGGVFVAQRLAPEAVRLTPQQTPVSRLVQSVPTETAGMFSGVRSVLTSLVGTVPSPAPSPLAVRRLCEMSDDHSGSICSRMNPPLSAILWTDDSPSQPRAVCKGRRCAEPNTRDAWVTAGNTYNGILLEDSDLSSRDSGVVFVSFGR